MARLAISKDYFPAYARLPRKAQRKADEFLRKFEHDSTTIGIHLEPIKRTIDTQLRSARIGDDYRMILRAPEQGDVFLVLWADHHDEAYRWAITKQTAVHPATGSLQIFDVTEATEAITTAPSQETATWEAPASPLAPLTRVWEQAVTDPPGLFDAQSDDSLFLAGVPRALLPSVRALVTDPDLDRLLPHLPPEAGEVLTALAAGISLDEALEEVLGRVAAPATVPTPPIDVTDVPAALARDTTQRQFRLLEDGLDLEAALKYPLDVWRVFLHPRQRRLAHARTKGPTRVLGGAGTGKTVVALHRAAFLVREVFTKPDDRVLFTTFNVNLAQDLRTQLGKLIEPDQLARVEVVNIDSWASKYLRSRGRPVRPAFEKEQRPHFESAYEVYGKDDISLDFYRMEWREVIQEQGLQSEEEYVRSVRKSRGVPLGRAERRRLWPVFSAYRDNLDHAGMAEPLDILRRARAELELACEAPRYRSVVVDETQDFAADGLRLLRAIAGPERPDDLFLVGDAHQRIYGRPVALSHCGIQVRGRRSQTLRINYRTTGAICRWSLSILKDVPVDDLDDGTADRRGYVSLREGPTPNVHACGSSIEEEQAVVDTVKACIEGGTPPEAICVVSRTQGPLRDRFGPALQRAGMNSVLLEQEEPRLPGVRLATMHRVKGLEFAVVLLAGVSKHDMPHSTPELRSEDPVMSAQALLRERSLLYVAASRARDAMHVFYSGDPSPFLSAISEGRRGVERPAPSRAPDHTSSSASSSSAPRSIGPTSPRGTDTELDTILAKPLATLQLPTRLEHWADREQLETLGDLVRHPPSTLLSQPNLGRKSVQEARVLVESLTGRRWEDLLAELSGESEPARDLGALLIGGGLIKWDALRKQLRAEDRDIALDGIPLSARLRNVVVAAGLRTLGDLANLSSAALMDLPNVGRGSLRELPQIITDHLRAVAEAPAFAQEGLLECFKAVVEPLEPMMRMIAMRRSGLGVEPMTLQELGDTFGVSRERIRQLETKLCAQLALQPWTTEARRRVDVALEEGALPLVELAQDPWWASASMQPSVVAFVIEDVLGMDVHVIDLGGASWLSRHKAAVFDEAFSTLVAKAETMNLPTSIKTFEPLVAEAAKPFGSRVSVHFLEELKGRMRIDSGRDPASMRVLAFGDTRNAEVLAILRAAPAPVHIDEVFRQIGRRMGSFSDEVLYFRRGYIGLRQHFPNFEEWQGRLVPAAVDLVQKLGPERQWHCGEILDELREEHNIPDWLTAFGLAALVKASSSLRYLGRLRVVLPGNHENDRRVYVHEAVEQILQEAGEPLLKNDLLERLDKRVGTSVYGVGVLNQPQFVRVDADRIGLLSRDVPGGATAIAEAGDHMEAVLLARRGRGLSDFYAHAEIVGLSQDHATWSQPLMMSILRSDGRFRLSQSGAIGLAIWDSTGVPTRLELVRGAIEEAGGRVTVESVLARIEAHYGEIPSRSSLISIAMNVGAGVDGDWVVSKEKRE